MKKIINKLGKKKIIILSILLLVLIASIGTMCYIKHDSKTKEETKISEKNKKIADDKMSAMTLKELVFLKDEELPKKAKYYIDYLPEEIEFSEKNAKLDLTKVDMSKTGSYEYSLTYFENKNTSTIHVVETEEQKEAKEKEIAETNKKAKETVEKVNEEIEKSEKEKSEKTEQKSEQKNVKYSVEGDKLDDKGNVVEESKPQVQISKTAQSNNYDFNISYLTLTMYSNDGYDAPGYNGELVYKFTKPVVYDTYSFTAYQRMSNFGNLDNVLYPYATELAKNTFGADSAYCIASVSHGFAHNSSGLIVGIVSKAIIGTKDEYDLCGNNRKTVYLNNRINLTQDDSDGGTFR